MWNVLSRLRSTYTAIPALLLGSCNAYLYMPNMHQVPLLREKGEARLAYAGSSSRNGPLIIFNEDGASGTELQAAYAVSDHWGLMVNGASVHANDKTSYGRGRLIEAGVGRFYPLGRHFTAEGYAGLGRGDVRYVYGKFPFWRLFAQPSIGYASRNFDFAITARLCYLDHDQAGSASLSTAPGGTWESAQVASELGNGRLMLEPGFVLRAGTRVLKFQIQYVHSTNLGRPLTMLEDNLSMGVQLNINNAFKRAKSKPHQ